MESIKYFSIKDFQFWNSLNEEMTQLERCESFMSYYYNQSIDEIRALPKDKLVIEYNNITETFEKTSVPIFYPLIEIEGKLYGYVDLSQMSLGEYVDLEKLCKDANRNLTQIMAILYRPITKHKFNSLVYKVVNTFKVATRKMTNIWEYYTLEKYEYANSVVNAEMMEKFPMAFAQGALSFFLLQTSLVSQSSTLYSQLNPKEKKTMKIEKIMKNLIQPNTLNIGDGLLRFVISRQLPSLTSQGISVSQI